MSEQRAGDLISRPFCLFFATNAFERFVVCLLVHETTAVTVALYEALSLRIEYLRTISNGTLSMTVTFGWICCHYNFTSFCLPVGANLPSFASRIQQHLSPFVNSPK